MAGYRHPRQPTTSHSTPVREKHRADHHPEDSASRQRGRYSRYTDYEDPRPRRRRRWAAGYIDGRSCPSYDYIDSRRKKPADEDEDASDVEYIRPRKEGSDELIEPQGHRGGGVSRTRARREGEAGGSQRQGGWGGRARERGAGEQSRAGGVDAPSYHSPRHRGHARQSPPPEGCSAAEGEASDVLSTGRTRGDDTASFRSGRSSAGGSARAASGASYVKRRRREGAGNGSESESESDDDGDYISLDEYIAGRSDCASVRGSSGEDEGEGSDAVGSDVEVRSHAGEGSDVASVSDGEGYGSEDDCIEDCYANYYGSRARR
ncbi:hypothetical protein G6514_007562 [Epicoccum nigrum]|nr:hypothetical protein G6514_007562 [Epicoccum nigrum]